MPPKQKTDWINCDHDKLRFWCKVCNAEQICQHDNFRIVCDTCVETTESKREPRAAEQK